MDVKKLAGLLMAFVLAVPVIANAPPGALALIYLALIALLYVIRCRRNDHDHHHHATMKFSKRTLRQAM